jgi:branched-chain amino acid transport system permease protein
MTENKLTLPTEYLILAGLALFPLGMMADQFGSQLTNLLIFAILALGLNIVVGNTGLLHLGIAAFFGIGAYLTGILTIGGYPFQTGFYVAAIASTLLTGLAGLLLGAPTLRLRGDYLALVTLGFGEVVRFSLRNLEEITGGMRGLNPIPPPSMPGLSSATFVSDYRPFFYLTLAILTIVVIFLRNLENSRTGRAWVAIREDELAASCMGINVTRAKLAAFAVSAALAGLAGCLYATKLTTTASPDAYDFNRSIIILCCLILGGLGSIRGTLVGVLILIGFDTVLAPALDRYLQALEINPEGKAWLTFSNWRLMIFGLALIVMMRIRPEGLLPSSRVQLELHETR